MLCHRDQLDPQNVVVVVLDQAKEKAVGHSVWRSFALSSARRWLGCYAYMHIMAVVFYALMHLCIMVDRRSFARVLENLTVLTGDN